MQYRQALHFACLLRVWVCVQDAVSQKGYVNAFDCRHISTDVISLGNAGEHFRLLFDTKGRYAINPISEEESKVCLLGVYADCALVRAMVAMV